MQNQVFETKGLIGPEAQKRNNRNIVILILVALAMVASIVFVDNSMNRSVEVPQADVPAAVESGISLPSVARTDFSTQQYWDLAAEAALRNAPEASAPATFTQQYWDLAAEAALRSAPEASAQATFTQQYWDLAAEAALRNAPEASAPATFTQQYWDLAAEAEEDAYFTEKYWRMSE